MHPNRSGNENSSDYESITTIEAFDSLLDNINEDPRVNQIDQSIEKMQIINENEIYDKEYNVEKECACHCKLYFYRFVDFMIFIIILISGFFNLITQAFLIIIFATSFYSCIILSYVFFISSIVSYAMAPINKVMSADYLNFALSLIQVILALPLIAFYIFYIIKSVKNLGEFFDNIHEVILKLLSFYRIRYKNTFLFFLSQFLNPDYQRIFNTHDIKLELRFFVFDLFLLVNTSAAFYITFCIDKFIIVVGMIYYASIIIQILLAIFPSYEYFVQTLFNIKCRPVFYIRILKKIYKRNIDSDDSDDSNNKKKKSNEPEKQENNSDLEDSDLNETSLNNSLQTELIEEEEEPDCNIRLFIFRIANKIVDYFEDLIKEEEEDNDEIIDDEFIDKLNEEELQKKKYEDIKKALKQALFTKDYLSIYYYSTEIAFDRHQQCRKMVVMYFFLILNLIVICFDIYHLIQDYSDYLLSSIIIRFILIPLFSFYNIATIVFHKAKDKKLRYINYWSIFITCLIIIAVIAGVIFTSIYKTKYRINNLDYIPPFDNITIANENTTTHPICDTKIFDVSAFDSFGYALGGYDIKRNEKVFENQMKIFFGENYSENISYTVYELDKNFLFMKFEDSSINTTIFAFRGFNSGPEIALQFELFASQYIIPLFEDIVPLMEVINDFWLSFYTDFFHAFGLRFFENRNLMVKYVNSIIKIYNEENYQNDPNVFFTGINTGGVVAKIIGTLLHRKSISFISYPMKMDFLESLFHFSSSYMRYVTNIFNIDGIFSKPDAEHSINIGIDTPLFHQSKFCTSGFCEVFSRFDNIYRTFCTMSEICGKGNQFNYYCRNIIGQKNLEIIRDSLQEND